MSYVQRSEAGSEEAAVEPSEDREPCLTLRDGRGATQRSVQSRAEKQAVSANSL